MRLALDLDGVLTDTRPAWTAWLDDAARRFRSIAELDPAALPVDRGDAATALDRWAAAGVGDWRAALERFAEDRAPLFFRPDAQTNATLRRLRAGGAELAAFTDAPAELARVALAHLGLTQVVALESSEARAVARLGAGARVVRTRGELAELAA